MNIMEKIGNSINEKDLTENIKSLQENGHFIQRKDLQKYLQTYWLDHCKVIILFLLQLKENKFFF